jgi:drug/metabolite transporter (DMT)-like permease
MKRTAYFFVIIAAALWGTIGIYARQLTALGFEPLQIVLIRAVVSSLSIIIFLLLTNRKAFKIKIRDSIYFVGTGILSFVFFNWCYFIAINRTSLSVAAILLYTAPAFVMVLSVLLFKEQMTKKKLLSLFITIIGCLFVTAFVKNTAQNISLLGILAGIGSGLGYALYSIFGRYALKKYDSTTVTLYTFIFAFIALLPTINFSELAVLLSNKYAVYYSIALGLAATVLPFLFYTRGLSYLETSRASIIATLEPVVATIVGIILFSEPITFYKIVGILLVIFAVFILREKKQE